MNDEVSFKFRLVSCCQCGEHFAITQARWCKLQASHELFHCPLGHEQYFARKYNRRKQEAA